MSLSDNWLAEQSAYLSPRDRILLKRAIETLENNILGGKNDPTVYPWAPMRGIVPSPRTYKGVWNWDSAFHAIATVYWDPALAREQIQIFLDAQLPSGALPDVIRADGSMVTDFGKPPVMPWAALRVHSISPNLDWLRADYPVFVRFEKHWVRDRGGEHEGLFHYDSLATDPIQHHRGARYESGWDTSVRWDTTTSGLWAIDLNCYMVMFYRSLQQMASQLDLPEGRAQWKEKAKALIHEIESRLWDDENQVYTDHFRANSKSTGVVTPASFMPLFIGTASNERAEKMAALAASPDGFAPGMPTVAYSAPQFNPADYWRGPTWLNVAYFALKGLKEYGYTDVAEQGKETILNWCVCNEDSLYEYYNSRTGKGLGAQQFGWSAAFVIKFIVNF